MLRKVFKFIWDRMFLLVWNPDDTALNPQLWNLSRDDADNLVIAGCNATELANEYGTPLHVVEMDRLQGNYLSFAAAFREYYPKTEIYCSYKTNPVPGVLQRLHGLGANAEVISHFELWLALQLGVRPEKIIFNGPGKTKEGLELAVAEDVGLINIDGPREGEIINGLAYKLNRIQKVGIRVVTSVGWDAQFGFNIRSGAALDYIKEIKKYRNLRPCAIHLHLGTGISNISTYVRAITEVLDFATLLQNNLGIQIESLDFGGGFGVPTVKHFDGIDIRLESHGQPPRRPRPESFPSIREYARKTMRIVAQYYPDRSTDFRPTIILEPGRALMSSSQILLTRVLELKPAGPTLTHVIIDAGKNLCIPTSWEYHEVLSANDKANVKRETYRIFGPLCHPNDVVFGARRLPSLKKENILAIMDAGAYFIPNQRNFSYPRPPVVAVSDGKHWILRHKETFRDMIRLDTYSPPLAMSSICETASH